MTDLGESERFKHPPQEVKLFQSFSPYDPQYQVEIFHGTEQSVPLKLTEELPPIPMIFRHDSLYTDQAFTRSKASVYNIYAPFHNTDTRKGHVIKQEDFDEVKRKERFVDLYGGRDVQDLISTSDFILTVISDDPLPAEYSVDLLKKLRVVLYLPSGSWASGVANVSEYEDLTKNMFFFDEFFPLDGNLAKLKFEVNEEDRLLEEEAWVRRGFELGFDHTDPMSTVKARFVVHDQREIDKS
jgi:hypothetical protein